MQSRLKPRAAFPTAAFRVASPLLASAVVALWQGFRYEDHGWLWAGVFFATVIVASPLLLLVRNVVLWALATMILVIAAQAVALSVWASVVDWS